MLQFHLELGKNATVRFEEKGQRKRILYLDTLKQITPPELKAAVSCLIAIHLRAPRSTGSVDTLSFQKIEIPRKQLDEVLLLLIGTKRLYFNGTQVKKQEDLFPPKVEAVKLAEEISAPILRLTDATLCFANLSDPKWEADLLVTSYQRKTVGTSHYYCSSDKVYESLLFLLEVGWTILDVAGKKLFKQTALSLAVRKEERTLVLEGTASFQGKEVSMKSILKTKRRLVELDQGSSGLIDWKSVEKVAGPLQTGEWVGDAHHLRKDQVHALLDLPEVHWEEKLLAATKIEFAPPAKTFQGRLFPYQQKGVDWLAFLYQWGCGGLLADEMGLGKTVQVLAFLSRLQGQILIVAPASLLFQWRSEIARFLPCLNAEIISYASLRQNIETYETTHYEAIVLDESQGIKTASTKTAQAAFRLKGNFRLAISGTPMENRVEELASQLRFIMPGIASQSTAELKQAIRPFVLRRTKEEVKLELPAKIEQTAWVEMTEPQKELYDTFLTKVRSGLLKKVEIDGIAKHRMEILEVILRLRQIAVDPRLIGEEIRGAKIDQLLTDLEECQGKVLIYSQFTSMLKLALKECPEGALYLDGSTPLPERAELVRRFQEEEKCRYFFLSLKAGGVGLNLTAASTVILLDPWWNEAVERQAIDRSHRIGQKKTLFAKRYLTPCTIEEKILSLKEEKLRSAEEMLDATASDLAHLLS